MLDDDYVNGTAKSLAYELDLKSKKEVQVLGLEDRSTGFSHSTDNLSPNFDKLKKIYNIIKKMNLGLHNKKVLIIGGSKGW